MSQKDIGNKIPIYKLKAGKEVEEYYDEWTVENKYDKDMVDWKLHRDRDNKIPFEIR